MIPTHDSRKRYVYGAGYAGRMLAGYLTFCKGKDVDAIVVSRGHKKFNFYEYPEDLYEYPKALSDKSIPVIEYDEIRDQHDAADIYITVYKGKDDVLQALSEYHKGGGGGNRCHALHGWHH